jgi:hypothetical protein
MNDHSSVPEFELLFGTAAALIRTTAKAVLMKALRSFIKVNGQRTTLSSNEAVIVRNAGK